MTTMLPADTPPPSGFQSDLTAGCSVRVLANGERRAVLCMRSGAAMVRDAWTSDKDDAELARDVLSTIDEVYAQHAKVTVRVRSDETALQTAIKRHADARLLGYTQSKIVDGSAARARLQEHTRYSVRPFTDDDFLQWLHDDATYYANLIVSLGEATDTATEYKRGRDDLLARLPLGIHTPSQCFRSLYDHDGTLLGRAWFDVQGRQSYCYKFMIEEEQRGKGIGKTLLAAWEAEAATLGATTLALHVYEQNKPAQRLYAGYGFHADAQTYEWTPSTAAA